MFVQSATYPSMVGMIDGGGPLGGGGKPGGGTGMGIPAKFNIISIDRLIDQ